MEDRNEKSLSALCFKLGDQVDLAWSKRYWRNGPIGGPFGKIDFPNE